MATFLTRITPILKTQMMLKCLSRMPLIGIVPFGLNASCAAQAAILHPYLADNLPLYSQKYRLMT